MLEYPLLLVFPLAMAFAAAFDLLTMTIPNKISIALVVAFLIVAPIAGLPWQSIGVHLLTGAAMLAIGFALFAGGYMGGGDAKLLAASTLWLGYEMLPSYLLLVCVLGGVLSVTVLALRRIPEPYMEGPAWLVRLHSKNSGVPYGLAIGGAALYFYPQTLWYTALIS